jgi:hypothetical protein
MEQPISWGFAIFVVVINIKIPNVPFGGSTTHLAFIIPE